TSNYSAARWLVNKKMPERIIPSTLHFFTTPFTLIAGGLYCVILDSLEFKFKSFLPVLIGLGIVMLSLGYLIGKIARKAIFKWNIEKEYKALNGNQRFNKNTFAFIFF